MALCFGLWGLTRSVCCLHLPREEILTTDIVKVYWMVSVSTNLCNYHLLRKLPPPSQYLSQHPCPHRWGVADTLLPQRPVSRLSYNFWDCFVFPLNILLGSFLTQCPLPPFLPPSPTFPCPVWCSYLVMPSHCEESQCSSLCKELSCMTSV